LRRAKQGKHQKRSHRTDGSELIDALGAFSHQATYCTCHTLLTTAPTHHRTHSPVPAELGEGTASILWYATQLAHACGGESEGGGGGGGGEEEKKGGEEEEEVRGRRGETMRRGG
jgi:hypothetical protein